MPGGFPSKFRKRHAVMTLDGTSPDTLSIGMGGQKYFRCNQFSALITSGGDTAVSIELKDSLGRIFYKDAADKDYKTAKVHRIFARDDTVTGLSFTVTDATGAALSATAGDVQNAPIPDPILEGPVTVTVTNAGTAGVMEIDLYVEV
jgi:hypothetical protein